MHRTGSSTCQAESDQLARGSGQQSVYLTTAVKRGASRVWTDGTAPPASAPVAITPRHDVAAGTPPAHADWRPVHTTRNPRPSAVAPRAVVHPGTAASPSTPPRRPAWQARVPSPARTPSLLPSATMDAALPASGEYRGC